MLVDEWTDLPHRVVYLNKLPEQATQKHPLISMHTLWYKKLEWNAEQQK